MLAIDSQVQHVIESYYNNSLIQVTFAILFDKLQLTAVVLKSPTATNVIIPNVHDAISRTFACCEFVLSFKSLQTRKLK